MMRQLSTLKTSVLRLGELGLAPVTASDVEEEDILPEIAPVKVVACVVELATTNPSVLLKHHRRPTFRIDSSVMATPPMMAAPLELKTVCSSKVAARSTRADMEERGEDTPINVP